MNYDELLNEIASVPVTEAYLPIAIKTDIKWRHDKRSFISDLNGELKEVKSAFRSHDYKTCSNHLKKMDDILSDVERYAKSLDPEEFFSYSDELAKTLKMVKAGLSATFIATTYANVIAYGSSNKNLQKIISTTKNCASIATALSHCADWKVKNMTYSSAMESFNKTIVTYKTKISNLRQKLNCKIEKEKDVKESVSLIDDIYESCRAGIITEEEAVDLLAYLE